MVGDRCHYNRCVEWIKGSVVAFSEHGYLGYLLFYERGNRHRPVVAGAVAEWLPFAKKGGNRYRPVVARAVAESLPTSYLFIF